MEAVMSEFDLVVRGNIVDPDGVAMDGWLAVSYTHLTLPTKA